MTFPWGEQLLTSYGAGLTSSRGGEMRAEIGSSLNHGLLQHYFAPFSKAVKFFGCSPETLAALVISAQSAQMKKMWKENQVSVRPLKNFLPEKELWANRLLTFATHSPSDSESNSNDAQFSINFKSHAQHKEIPLFSLSCPIFKCEKYPKQKRGKQNFV